MAARDLAASTAAGPQLTVGEVTIHAQPGQDGRELGRDFMAEVRRVWHEEWGAQMSQAAPAVGR
jgi:hypothetical protein